ncbi:MAG: hypothetical protein FWE09_01995 [Treponema sp.]|nr:hypothetical protein [Treponema sp.]
MDSVFDFSSRRAFLISLGKRSLRGPALRCMGSIFRNFFFEQACSRFLPRGIPVSQADHPLDERIPFAPEWIDVYIDFVPYWLRALTFLDSRFPRASEGAIRDLLRNMGRLYAFAARVYRRNMSTTRRPFYVARPGFMAIHLLDPHLMCVPSLHVMVVVYACEKFERIIAELGADDECRDQIEEMRRGALAVCQAILFVKQHSANCIGASLYALTRFDAALFPAEKARAFLARLFEDPPEALLPGARCRAARKRASCSPARCKTCALAQPAARLSPEDAAEIRGHIARSFEGFLAQGETARSWEEPILDFLRGLPLSK